MPGELNGRQLARRLRRECPSMRIVLMSGYTEEDAAYGSDFPILRNNFV